MWKFMVRVKGKILFLLFDIYVVSEHVVFSVRGRRFRGEKVSLGCRKFLTKAGLMREGKFDRK
jgi:hypothetical protein